MNEIHQCNNSQNYSFQIEKARAAKEAYETICIYHAAMAFEIVVRYLFKEYSTTTKQESLGRMIGKLVQELGIESIESRCLDIAREIRNSIASKWRSQRAIAVGSL